MSFADLKHRKQTKSEKSYISVQKSALPESAVPTSIVPPQATNTQDTPTASTSLKTTIPKESVPVYFDNTSTPTEPGVSFVTPSEEATNMGGLPDQGAPREGIDESGMYKGLPSFLEIRESNQSGRGLWSKGSSAIRSGERSVPYSLA